MQIELTPDIENALVQVAITQGINPEILALNVLRERFIISESIEITEKEYKTLADFLKGYTGVLSSTECVPGGARMSEKCGEKFTQILLKKQQHKHISSLRKCNGNTATNCTNDTNYG